MNQSRCYPISKAYQKQSHLDVAAYQNLYQQSLQNPSQFWRHQANEFIDWFEAFTTTYKGDLAKGDVQWFVEGRLNASYNCLDRHLPTHSNQAAIIWEGNESHQIRRITYAQLHQEVSRFANGLKSLGATKGTRICLYMPMIPEAIVAMLACTRIGAVHSVVFAGFSSDSLTARIHDAGCEFVITADESLRGSKIIPLKQNCDAALQHCPGVKNLIVVKHTQAKIVWQETRDIDYHALIKGQKVDCPAEPMASSDPLFMLYTSGSTGKPKGIVHATGGYLVYTAMTFHYVFDYHPKEVFWCTADIGWITGHSYLVYGPLLNGATILMYEGIPSYPDFGRFWKMIDKHQVNIFYTAPTALRALRKEGDAWIKQTKRTSLKLLGTVGEPINPDVWQWYYEVVGEQRCPIVDTWWQTETGGILLSPLPGPLPQAPGSAGRPFFGIKPEILTQDNQPVAPGQSGKLMITTPWPGMMQGIHGDHQRFIDTYLSHPPGLYYTGDGAHCDAQGNYWISGRLDDVMMVSGHRIGTEEVESALLSHSDVSEAAVVGVPHAIKGEAIHAFITLKADVTPSDDLKHALIIHVRNHLSAIAAPETIQWAKALPKTRSGKIMRRILRKIAANEVEDLGDISTLSEPEVIEDLIRPKQNITPLTTG